MKLRHNYRITTAVVQREDQSLLELAALDKIDAYYSFFIFLREKHDELYYKHECMENEEEPSTTFGGSSKHALKK